MNSHSLSPAGLILTPGASAGKDNKTLVAVEKALVPLPCRRIDFPNRLAGRRGPDRPEAAIAHVGAQSRSLADELGVEPGRLLLGGRSFGGRMCSMAVAQGLPAAGLVLLSYPLHPPGRAGTLRVSHFPELRVPALFVSGESDPFGSPAEFEAQVAAIPGPVTLVRVPGGHDPTGLVGIGQIVRDWVATI